MDLARAPCRAPLTARKKGSGYENASDPGLQLAPVSAGNAVTSDTYIAHPMRRLIRTLVYVTFTPSEFHSSVV